MRRMQQEMGEHTMPNVTHKSGGKRLTPVQQEVMRWLSQKWSARVSAGAAVEINGKRVCNLSTMKALAKLGLVEQDDTSCWVATSEGLKLCPGSMAESD